MCVMIRQPKTARQKRGNSNATGISGGNKGRGIYLRKDGRELRRVAVYLPVELARSLLVRCAQDDMELSHTVSEAVAEYLRSSE